MKKLLVLVLVSLVFVLSCGGKTEGSKGASATFNIEAEPTSLDPQLLTDTAGFQVGDMLYEGLVRLNDKNEIVPAGAESWEVSEDGKTIVFKVRKGMKWSNGDELKAQDFARGMKRGLEPETAGEYAFIMYYIEGAEEYNTGELKDYEKVGIKVLDDYTIEIKLKNPTPYFVKTMIMPIYFPLHEKALENFGDKYATEADKSIYNGPYVMKEWVHDNKVVMEKNPNYWNADNIKLDKLTAVMVGDYDAATNLFQNKELDLTKISLEKIDSYKDELVKVSDGRLFFLGYNLKHPLLKNLKIRQALSLAINKEELANDILNGTGINAGGVVANGVNGLNGDFREEAGDLYSQYSNTDVKSLFEEGLKELGMTTGDVKLTLTVDEKGNGKKEAAYYQAQWKEKLGIDVDVEILTYKERISRAKNGNFEIVRYAWGPDYADPMTYLEIFMSNSPFNFAKWTNTEYDKLMTVGQTELNENIRVESMKKGEKILADDFVFYPLYYQNAIFIKNPNLNGVALRSIGNAVDFYRAEIKK